MTVTTQEKPALIANLKAQAREIFQTGVISADPYRAVKHCLAVRDGMLELRLDPYDSSRCRTGTWNRIHLLAFGKGACAMARAAMDILPSRLLSENILIITNYENHEVIEGAEVIAAAHPLPDQSGLTGAKKIIEMLDDTREDDLVLVLISGGGSALVPAPAEGITLADKIATTGLLLACGATINQINCVRKHLSCLKGGGLTRLAWPASVHALLLSDVPGDDLSAIASGPTVPDSTSFQDACTILEEYHLREKIPVSVKNHLQKGLEGKIPETPKPGDRIFCSAGHTLVASNAVSLEAVRQKAADLAYEPVIFSDQLCGEARDVAADMVAFAKKQINHYGKRSLAIIAGGETTVTLQGSGKGGRNQEMALTFALAAQQHALPAEWVFLSGGTDGRDGPTDAAGGLVDPDTLQRILTAGGNPGEMLANNDSYNALSLSNDLLLTGATGTNVADLQVLLIQPNS